MMMHKCDSFIDKHGARIGRMMIGLLFLVSGVWSLLGFKDFAAYVGTIFPLGTLVAIASVVIHIAGGLSLIVGIRVRHGAYLLTFFTLLTILLIHGPGLMKAVDPMTQQTEMIMLLKNIAIIGGLLLVAQSTTRSNTQG